MSNFSIISHWRLHQFLALFGLRRRRVYWGIVYDSVTKQPIDPAMVRFIDVHSGHVVQDAVTDITGRYGFLSESGIFKLFVQKTNYVFPSLRVSGSKDGLYSNLYHGEFFTITGGSEVVAFNIPMDPLASDWNQSAKQAAVKFSPFLESFMYKLGLAVFLLVFCSTAILLYLKLDALSYSLAAVMALVILLAIFLPQPRLWGTLVSSHPPEPGKFFTLELCHPQITTVRVAKAKVFPNGKFFLLAQPGDYLLKILLADGAQKNPEPPKLLKELKVHLGMEGVLVKNITL